MIEDEQTHTVPKSSEGVAHVACFMGYDDVDAISHGADGARWKRVQGHYARLFQREADLADVHGNLVFTGVEDDPGNAGDLARDGLRRCRRKWRAPSAAGIMAASAPCVRPRARELLTKLMPAILKALAATADPDAAFVQFDRFLSNLPSGVQLFSLFMAKPEFLDLVGARWWARRRGWPRIWRARPRPWMRCWMRISWRSCRHRAQLDPSLQRQLHRRLRRAARWRAPLCPGREFPRRRADWWMARPMPKQAGPPLPASPKA